jgi:hypothetical protein
MAMRYDYTEEDLAAIGQGHGYTVFDPENLSKFRPNIAFDFLTGKAYLNDAFVSGNIITPTLRITADNSDQYVTTQQDGYGYTYKYIHIPNGYGAIQIEDVHNGVSGYIKVCLPVIGEEEVGRELIIMNVTSGTDGSPAGVTMEVVSGNNNPSSGAWGDKNAWLMCGIAPQGLNPYVHGSGNKCGYLAVLDLYPQTIMRFRAVSFHPTNVVNIGTRGWVMISENSID